MLPLLLIGCDLLSPTPIPEPLALSVGLPAAQHAGSTPARDFLHLAPSAQPTEAEHEALCAWMRGEATDDRIAQTLQARGDMGFALLEVSSTEIRLGGTVVLSLTDEVVPADARRGHLVSALYDRLFTETETRKSTAARCRAEADHPRSILLAIAPGVPFETVRQVLYTAGQAEIGAFYLMVSGPAGSALPTGSPINEDRQLTVRFQEDGSHLYTRSAHPSSTAPYHSLAEAFPLLEGGPLGCGILLPQQTTRWSAVISEMDAFAQLGASRFILAGVADASDQATPAPAPPAAIALSRDDTVAAFLMEQPASSLPSSRNAPRSASECSLTGVALAEVIAPEADKPEDASVLDLLSIPDSDGTEAIAARDTTSAAAPEPLVGASVTSVSLGLATIDGPLRPELLQKALQQIRGPLRSCYQQPVPLDGPLSSTLTVRFTVRSSGAVSSTTILEDTASEATTACITGRIERLKLPRLPGNLTATVTIPLTFSFK